MKKITAFLLSLTLIFATASIAFAEEGNFGGGGGGMGGGTGTYYWNVGYDGVRISVVNVSTNAIESIEDFSNKSISPTYYHFGKVCKLTYRKGKPLILNSAKYTYQNLSGMPQIILKSGSNIAAIKRYFTSKGALNDISAKMGIDYKRIKTGQVKLVVEPMAYFCYDGGYYAMTATEAALFDKAVGGKLKYNMRPFSHNNLPLSLFLESSDLGIPAYTGSTTLLCSASDSYAAVDDLIISQLGVGIVYGVGGVVTPAGDVTVSDYEFRADTDVIIPVTFKNNGGDIVPSSNAYITYTCSLGTTYNVQLVCPSGESQLVWLKWHTPKAAQTVTFAVSSAAVSMSPKTITCKIVKYDEATPPDPQYEDKARKINNTAEREFGNRTLKKVRLILRCLGSLSRRKHLPWLLRRSNRFFRIRFCNFLLFC